MSDLFVFTEAFNCGRLLIPFLDSYFQHHDETIHIVMSKKDIEEAGSVLENPKVVVIDVTDDQNFNTFWEHGHAGTALAFASAIRFWGAGKKIIHFDSDVLFKQNCIDEIVEHLNNGYAAAGPMRAYKHNLGGHKQYANHPDAISTYAFGVDSTKIPEQEFSLFIQMCHGRVDPTGREVLDFFDPVTFSIIDAGGKVKYLCEKDWGSTTNEGSLDNGFENNVHFNVGNKIVHFAGVGSGLAFEKGRSSPLVNHNLGYLKWALGRWSLYSKLLFDEEVSCPDEAIYSELTGVNEGKKMWTGGGYDDSIYESMKRECVE